MSRLKQHNKEEEKQEEMEEEQEGKTVGSFVPPTQDLLGSSIRRADRCRRDIAMVAVTRGRAWQCGTDSSYA